MSSIPGYTLEKYVAWNWSLVVEEDGENNTSLGIAEALGNIAARPRLTRHQIKPIMDLYEPYREGIENRLCDYDEGRSWRDYAGYAFDFIPREVDDQAEVLVKALTQPKQGA